MHVTLSLAASASSGAASPALLFGSLVVVNLVFVGLFFFVRWALRAYRPKVDAVVPTTVSRLPRERTGGSSATIALSGVVAAGPEGPVTSPLSRESCAWYRLQSFRRRQGIDDVHWEKVSELASEGDVVIGDGTGSVRLSMTDVENFGGWLVRSSGEPRRPVYGGPLTRVETALTGRSGLRQQEYVMPVGAGVTVLGDLVVTDGQVRPAPGTKGLVATPLSLEAWQADQAVLRSRGRRTAAVTYAICAVMAVLVDGILLWVAFASLR